MTILSDNLKRARNAAGFTQQQMADFFGVTRGAVAQWEAGTTSPETSRLLDISEYLGTSITALFDKAGTDQDAHAQPPEIGRFWMVLGIGQGVPRYQHGSVESAQIEAKRLAGLYPEITFVVLAAVDAYASVKPQVNKIVLGEPVAPTDDIPF